MATEQNSKTEQEGRDAEREGGSKVPIMVGSSEEEERRVGVVREERKEWDQIFIQCLYTKDNLPESLRKNSLARWSVLSDVTTIITAVSSAGFAKASCADKSYS